jgi:hypothetical protein
VNTCKTCRFWVPGEEREKERNASHPSFSLRDPVTYERIDPQPFEVRYCASPKLRDYERPEIDGAATVDGSEYFSALATGPDFGCIHHTPE